MLTISPVNLIALVPDDMPLAWRPHQPFLPVMTSCLRMMHRPLLHHTLHVWLLPNTHSSFTWRRWHKENIEYWLFSPRVPAYSLHVLPHISHQGQKTWLYLYEYVGSYGYTPAFVTMCKGYIVQMTMELFIDNLYARPVLLGRRGVGIIWAVFSARNLWCVIMTNY